MDAKKLQHFKDMLLEKRQEVLERIEQLREVALESNYKDSYGDHSGYAYHMADQGTDAMEREKAFLFLSREKKYLQQIEDALQRIELNEYGICRVCGEEIDEKRLEIVPTTRICVPCKLAEAKKKG
ncbi:MAG: TraR/DksA family transcriptional regulator [Calditrichaeota bacterium]|nr:MAG: TraR/DksA family transcriptional regulator [Calditrichota bacterium]